MREKKRIPITPSTPIDLLSVLFLVDLVELDLCVVVFEVVGGLSVLFNWLGSVLLNRLGSVLLNRLGSVLLNWSGSVLLNWLGSVLFN